MSKLKRLDLSDNSLGLTFTQNWVPPFQLRSIYLRSCQLGPTFPMWLQTQNKFVYIDISNATISGIIPKWFWTKLPLQKVMTMNISNNNLQGTIPNVSSTYVSTSMYLGSNQLEVLLLRNNNLVEGIPFSIRNCTWLVMLDLSENKLLGYIPDWIGTKEELQILSLGNNQFFGSLPAELASLDSLDLSRNQFVGSIPSSLAQIYDLSVLDLSHNHLEGEIPTSTQLQSFNTSSYEDNLGLCGPPLEKCIEGGSTEKPNVKVDEDEYSLLNNDFF
ncbi:hypothetical protein V8G54_012748 [Vigna mungo]|uniref:Uncharacterized protein n=1 Tax=Vigna mungo TaxID=3915 RepID=A0AAQ3S2N2_VIGMU